MRYFFVVAGVLLWTTVLAQSSFTIKYFAMTIHPFGDRTAHLQPRKLDKDARFVQNHGVFLGYERFVYEDLVSVKYIQGLLRDCSDGNTLVSHLGVRLALVQTPRQSLYLGIGPTFIARESWKRFGSAYISSGFFNEYEGDRLGMVQWKFVPYGLEFEYDYRLSPKNHLSISITPGLPLATICSLGWKHWIKPYTGSRPPVLFIPKG